MKGFLDIGDQEKWNAVTRCDGSYDDIFLYGVKTTGIFCRPSCRSRTPVRENVVFFHGAKEAIESGFRPCKRCCPDKANFQPDLDFIKKAKDIFESNYNNPIDLNTVSKQLAVSRNHLIRLFKQYTGSTPVQYIVRARINKAEELLKKSHKDILEVAYTTGFKSLSHFYKCFKDYTGYTPNEYRKQIDK